MISVFYASISIVAAAVVGLLLGLVAGVRWTMRYGRVFEKVMNSPRYINTAGAVYVLDKIRKLIEEGATVEELRQWIDADAQRCVAVIDTAEGGQAIVDGWREDVEREKDQGDR